MPIVAFDSKEFRRWSEVPVIDDKGIEKKVRKEFYTLLGAGVWFKEGIDLKSQYQKALETTCSNFKIKMNRPVYDSRTLVEEMGKRRAIPFCDQILSQLQKLIKTIHISYVILSPDKQPTVRVGGRSTLSEEIPTPDFMRKLNSMFSYLSAWNFVGKSTGGIPDWTIYLDSFSSKETPAWYDLTNKVTPIIFPRGDECNPYINLADYVAFLTDIKLYTQHLRLEPDNVRAVWKDYLFTTEVHFMDDKIRSKYTWQTDNIIKIDDLFARPMTFLLVDQLERLGVESLSGVEKLTYDEIVESMGAKEEAKPRKFNDIIRRSPVFAAVATNAYLKGGGLKFWHRQDFQSVRDGDTIVYVGPVSKRTAEILSDAYNVEIVSGKELRQRLSKTIKT